MTTGQSVSSLSKDETAYVARANGLNALFAFAIPGLSVYGRIFAYSFVNTLDNLATYHGQDVDFKPGY